MTAAESVPAPPAGPGRPPVHTIMGLDGLRAVAAMAVVAYHINFLARSGTGPVAEAAAVGWIGVDLFFTISGFILFLPFARAARDGGSVPLRRYFVRRARRILPAYWLNLFILVTLTAPVLLTTGRGWSIIAANATFTAEYAGLPSVNVVYWSLYCELAFYVALPVMALAFIRRRWIGGLIGALVIGCAYRFAVVSTVEGVENYFSLIMQFPGVIDQFAFGMTAAAIWVTLERRAEPIRMALAMALVTGGALGVVLIAWTIQRSIGLATYWSGSSDWGPWAIVTLRPMLSACFAAVIIGVCARPSWIRSALELRPVRYLGVVSYGIYLWHLPIIRGLAEEVEGRGRSSLFYLVAFVAVMALSTAWAAISYHFVEKRFLGGGERSAPPSGPATRTPEREVAAAS